MVACKLGIMHGEYLPPNLRPRWKYYLINKRFDPFPLPNQPLQAAAFPDAATERIVGCWVR